MISRLSDQVFATGSSGILAQGRWLKTRALSWAFSLFSLALCALFASVFGATWLHLHGPSAYLLPIGVPLLASGLYILLVRRFEKRAAGEFRIDRTTLPALAIGFCAGGFFIIAMWLLLYAVGLYRVQLGPWTQWFDDLIFDSYISAVLEELAFRAVLLRIFAGLWGVRSAVLLSSVLFGLAHLSHGSWLGILGIAVNGGILMGLVYVMTGRLWVSIGLHLGYDFIETSILGVGSRHGLLLSQPKQGTAIWLTGGTFGPDAAVPAILVGLIFNLWLWHKVFSTGSFHKTQP